MAGLRRLRLTNFRSYDHLDLQFDAQAVAFFGPNGAGKTNILEALSFLAPGRGIRRAKLTDVGRKGGQGDWAVVATLVRDGVPVQLGTGQHARAEAAVEIKEDERTQRRQVRIDGDAASGPAAFTDHVQVSWLTPQMDRLFIEGASSRRRFLDRLVLAFHPEHSKELAAYERLMRERNRLLSDGGGDPSWLAVLESQMAGHAVAMAAARLDAVSHLQTAIDMGMTTAAGAFPRASLKAEGLLESGLQHQPAVDVEESFRQQLRDNRGRDGVSGRTTEGPHRSDFLVSHVAKSMPADQCSTGEQKALLIGITLASARLSTLRHGQAPVLLLDEVAAHLDEGRRQALFDELFSLGAQIWLTGTDRHLFDALGTNAQFFHVEDSRLREA
ncbi:MAG: DNA replication/repair protein RecF [Kordiimonas sp.]|nr:DNA replication/repair protein RecF [Kordiimonas sp.]